MFRKDMHVCMARFILFCFTYWQTSVIEENISLLEFTKNSLLLVLLDGITNFISSNFVLFSIVQGFDGAMNK